MISYAQNGEDVVLRRAFADRKTPGFYIDVGACHPVENSVTAHFYEKGWRGINIESRRTHYRTFLISRPCDINVTVALDMQAGSLEFFPMTINGLKTVDAAQGPSNASGSPSEVPVVTLAELIARHASVDQDIAFLKIDVDGWEGQLLAGMNLRQYRPQVVVVEAVDAGGCPIHEAWEANLLKSGYCFALFDGWNRFYCRDEDADKLVPRLTAPANTRDHWIHVSQMRLQQANKDLVKAVEAATHSEILALKAAELSAVEADRARQEAARALEREKVAEETLAELETRARVEREMRIHEEDLAEQRRRDEEELAEQQRRSEEELAEQRRRKGVGGFFRRMLRLS